MIFTNFKLSSIFFFRISVPNYFPSTIKGIRVVAIANTMTLKKRIKEIVSEEDDVEAEEEEEEEFSMPLIYEYYQGHKNSEEKERGEGGGF